MLQISPSSQAPFKNLIRIHLPFTDPTSLNQADTLLIQYITATMNYRHGTYNTPTSHNLIFS